MMSAGLTEREREYLDCEVPMLSGGSASLRIIGGIFASMAQAIFSPSSNYGKADRGLMRTARELRYTRYKKAVLRKEAGTPKKYDEKLLQKLNGKDFVLAEDTYDPDEFTKQVYEEYMRKREKRTDKREQ
ncbi:MAG: hypothetical protein IJH07_02620 [Ruminococcus sp.]|nr:hypothetical protein [Ruminococcus sp.]